MSEEGGDLKVRLWQPYLTTLPTTRVPAVPGSIDALAPAVLMPQAGKMLSRLAGPTRYGRRGQRAFFVELTAMTIAAWNDRVRGAQVNLGLSSPSLRTAAAILGELDTNKPSASGISPPNPALPPQLLSPPARPSRAANFCGALFLNFRISPYHSSSSHPSYLLLRPPVCVEVIHDEYASASSRALVPHADLVSQRRSG